MGTVLISGKLHDGSSEHFEIETHVVNGCLSANISINRELKSLDLSSLSSLTGLQQLLVHRNYELTNLDLSPLSSLTGLQQLNLSHNVELIRLDLSPLSSLTELQQLDISWNGNIKKLDLSPLSSLTKLKQLDLSWNGILTTLDLDPLSNLTELQQLNIGWTNEMTTLDLSPLKSLTGLQQLSIGGIRLLRDLDLTPLSGLTQLQQLYLGSNYGLKTLDLTPLNGLTQLQQLYLGSNYGLKTLDLTPLNGLTQLQQLNLSNNSGLTTLDVSPLCSLTKLQRLNFDGSSNLTRLESFLSRSAIHSILPTIFSDSLPIKFVYTPLNSFQFIDNLLPLIMNHERPWKLHHLIQSTLSLLNLEWLGMLDMNGESLARIIHHHKESHFRELARDKFISHWIEQINSGGSTIGVSMELVREIPELGLMADRIIELRNKELGASFQSKKSGVFNKLFRFLFKRGMQKSFNLAQKSGTVDVRPLHLTVYGSEILQALKIGKTCSVKKFKKVSSAFKKLGFELTVEDRPIPIEISHPSYMSESLVEYVLRLVKSRISVDKDG